MNQTDNPKSYFLPLMAVALVVLVALAIFFVLRTDTKEDPTITASYKALSKKLVHESPLPTELTAEFQLTREGRWVANGPVSDTDLRTLAKKQQFLDTVQVIGGEITPKGIEVLKDRHVRKLKLHYFEFDPECAEALSELPEIQCLDLRDKTIDDEMITHLTGLPQMRQLHLHESRITKKGVEYIVKTFPALTDIEVSDNRNFDDDCLLLVAGLKKLRNININRTGVTHDALSAFLKNTPIEELAIGDLNVDDRLVCKLPLNLEGLELSHNPVSDTAIDYVGRMKKLEYFRLEGTTNTTKEGLWRLQQRLPQCMIFSTKNKKRPEETESD